MSSVRSIFAITSVLAIAGCSVEPADESPPPAVEEKPDPGSEKDAENAENTAQAAPCQRALGKDCLHPTAGKIKFNE